MREILLIGNPNVGKSTLFNRLTKSSEHTGNFHGVTVEEKSKIVKTKTDEYKFVDLPGIYSLSVFSNEEEVSKDKILSKNIERILIVDANTTRRNLYLALELSELNLPFKIVINNYDYFLKRGNKLDVEKLNKNLGVVVKNINAKKVKLINFENELLQEKNQNLLKFHEKTQKSAKYLENFIKIVKNRTNLDEKRIIKAFNGIYENLNENDIKFIQSLLPEIIKARYDYIDEVLQNVLNLKENYVYGASKADKFLLNPIVMILGFLLTFFLSIYVIFFLLGPCLSDALIGIINFIIINPIMNLLYSVTDNIWFLEFVSGGIFSSVITVLSFLPQVVLLYVFLTILEDSGLIARMCFVFDDFLSKLGLNGKSIYIMLLGLGCNTMATTATKNLNGKNLRIKSAILNPYISCMARLPIFVIIASAFFGSRAYFVVVGLYLLGLVVALIFAKILNKTILPTEAGELLLEFPPLKNIDLSHVMSSVKTNALDFTKRIFGVVVCVGMIVWILTHTASNFAFTEDITKSVLYLIAGKISFIFAPIGLNSPAIICALVVGIMAKELIVSIFSISNAVATIPELIVSLAVSTSVINFTTASALSFLVLTLLYSPCMSTIAVIKKDYGSFAMWFCLISSFTIAYMLSFIVYSTMTYGIIHASISLIIVALIMVSIIYLIKKIKTKKCLFCTKNCNKY